MHHTDLNMLKESEEWNNKQLNEISARNERIANMEVINNIKKPAGGFPRSRKIGVNQDKYTERERGRSEMTKRNRWIK